MDARAAYATNLELIRQLIGITSRQRHLNPEDAEEFSSFVHVKLLEKEGAVFAQFQGSSSLRTYLTVVIQRLYQDFRYQSWGKWRPSAEASRRGTLAMDLEKLMFRDGFQFEQAYQTLTVSQGHQISREALASLAAELPVRVPRTRVADDQLAQMPAPQSSPDESPDLASWQTLRDRTEAALAQVLGELELLDRTILKLCFLDGVKIVQVARLLSLDQKKLYRRVERILSLLRTRLTDVGIGPEDVTQVVGRAFGSIRISFDSWPEKSIRRVSNSEEGRTMGRPL